MFLLMLVVSIILCFMYLCFAAYRIEKDYKKSLDELREFLDNEDKRIWR